MYHIKEDKRSINSAELIYEGYMRCLEKKEFSKVTISDVQKESYVGRATIYRLFDRLSDVLAYKCDKGFYKLSLMKELGSAELPNNFFNIFLRYWMQQHKLLETIIRTNNHYILYESHKRNEDQIKELLLKNKELNQVEMEYLHKILIYLMMGVFTAWVEHDKIETEQEVVQILKAVLFFCYKSL